MSVERSSIMLAEELSRLEARIAELERENEELRSARISEALSSVETQQLILESITDAFAAIDKNFRYIYVNSEAERMLGMDRRLLLGGCIWDFFPDCVGTIVDQKFREALTTKTPLEFEHFYPSWNRWFSDRVHPTKEGGLAIYWREITKEKSAQAKLQRQALLLEQVHDSIVATDLTGKISYWNAGAQKMYGYRTEDVLGQHISLLYFEEDRAVVGPQVMEPLLREGHREIELRQRRKSGEECYIRVSLSVLRDEANLAYGLVGVATDITAQRQTERALRASEERYRLLVNRMPQLSYVVDANGKTEMVNRQWEEYTGVPASQSLNEPWHSLLHPLDIQPVRARWMKCLQTGETFEREYRLRAKNGNYRWHLGRAVRMEGADGFEGRWIGTAIDIHDSKSAEQALRESEERFRLAAQAVEGIVYDWDLQTGRVDRSGNLEGILGISVSKAEPTESWWQDRVHPDDALASSLNFVKNLKSNGNRYKTEFRMRHADGHWVSVIDKGFIVRNEAGTPVRVVGTTYDVTERRRLERELKFQADMLATTNDAVIALDSRGLVSYCNAGVERMYGIRSSEVIGRPLAEIHADKWLKPEDEERAKSELAKCGVWKGETVHTRKDGTKIVVSSTINALAAEFGGGMLVVSRDVSQQKRAELEIQDRAAQLVRANEDLLHFAFAVSHDLKTPLRSVISFSQLLELKYKERLDEKGVEFLRWIKDSGTRMDTMLRDLLDFAKVAGGERQPGEPTSLEKALDDALESLHPIMEEAQASVSRDPLPTVAADPAQISQLFQNLIGNSLKYRKPETAPLIHISAKEEAGDWVVTVRDNGIGFKPEEAEQIFGVFQRLHKEFAGTGIGLSICKRIVERFGGRIWATGKEGEGAAFSFSIPTRPQTVIEAVSAPASYAENPSLDRHFDELFHTLNLAPAVVRELDGTITVWTQGAERLFGWTRSEAVGQSIHTLLQKQFTQPLGQIEIELLRTGEWSGEIRAAKKDGGTLWLASHWALYRDGSGRPQSVIEVSNDITALKEAQAALLRSTEQRDLALRAGQMGIWKWNSNTGELEWSEMIERILGMKPGSFEGTFAAFYERIHPDDRQSFQDGLAEAFKGKPVYDVENRVRREDGSYCWLRGQGQVVFDENQQPTGLIGVAWEITSRKQSQLDQQFLLDLGDKLTRISDTGRMADLAVKELGDYLGVVGCAYVEIDLPAENFTVLAHHDKGGRAMLGTYPLPAFGAKRPDIAVNRVTKVSDASADPRTAEYYAKAYLPLDVRSFLSVPLTQEGVWRATLAVADNTVHEWSERDEALLCSVAERLWLSLENLRLLQETKERKEQFEATFEQAAVGLAHVSLTGEWLRVNDRLCEITGYSREELFGGRFQDITHPDDLASDLEQYQALQRGETHSYKLQKRYFRKDGKIIWVNLTVALVRDPDGAPKYAISAVEDISESKRTAEALEESNRLAALRLREIESIYAQAPVGLLFLDKDLRFVRINDHLAKLNGVPAAEHIGRTIAEVLPDAAGLLEPLLRNAMETRQPIVEKEIRGATRANDGVESDWLVSYFPFEGSDGSVLGLNAVIQNITERKQAETARLETAERLRIATSAAQLGVFVWDALEDRVFWENDRMYEIVGRRPEDGVNNAKFLGHIVLPEDAAGFEAALRGAMKPGELFRHSCRIRRDDGGLRWVEFSGRFEKASNRNSFQLTGVMADISQRVEAEKALRERRQLLLRVLDSLYAFVGVMSPDGVLLEANRAPLEAAGIQSQDVIGKLMTDTYWWSYSPEVKKRISEAIHKAQAGEPSRFDVPARMKDGKLMALDFMLAPLRNESGEIEYLIPSAVPIEERKQMEEALRRSEERYRLAEWATNDGLWDWTTATDYCYFSPQFKSLLGLRDDELEDRTTAVFARLHPEDEPRLYEAVRLNWEERKPYDLEIRIRIKDGSYRWFRTRGESVRDSAGQVVRMVGAMTDIHDRKMAEVRAREQDQQWRRMIDSIEQLAWMAHADGYIYWYNRRWYEYTGTTPEQMEGWGWQSVHDPQVLPEVMEKWQESIRTGEPFEMEFPLRDGHGEYRSFLTRIMPVRDSLGQVVKWFGTNTNIDALRKEQDVLKESERKFRELAEALPEIMWGSDAEGKMTYLNPQWFAYTGLRKEQGLADNWVSIIHPDDLPRLLPIWQRVLGTGEHYEFEARIRRHDGVYRWFLNRAEPVKDSEGRIVKWLGTSTDIHEQKLTEQELRRSNEDLEQFAYAASHDLREPLRGVAIYTQLLTRKYRGQDEEAERFANVIINGTKRMEALLNGILDYSHAGEVAEGAAVCDSNAALQLALRNLEAGIAESGATITHDALPEAVSCSEMHVMQLFQNLLGNALKYHGQEALKIHVSAEQEQTRGWLKFAVADNGIGIEQDYLEQIFGMFKRLHKNEYSGVGVGLAICKRIVERQGGRIWAESEVGMGTTIYFTLPAA